MERTETIETTKGLTKCILTPASFLVGAIFGSWGDPLCYLLGNIGDSEPYTLRDRIRDANEKFDSNSQKLFDGAYVTGRTAVQTAVALGLIYLAKEPQQ